MRLILDTTILIDYLRRKPSAVTFVENLVGKPFVSAITVAELYAGIRDGKERGKLERTRFGFDVVLIDDFVAERGGLLYRQYAKSHNVSLADALIAACAEVTGAKLATHNRKHFPMFADLLVPY